MPVEQGLPWHPVATGLAGPAIPFVVAASHAHALPSPPFWFPVPAVLVASPASLCPSSLSAVLALVPPGVAPAFCVSVLLLPLSVGAPGCPFRAPLLSHPPAPPVQGFHISVRPGLSRAQLAGHGPVATPVAGTPRRAGCSPRPCGVRGHLVEGGGGGCLLMARSACAAFGGCCSARTSWFPCVLLCVLLGLVSLPCVGRLCAQLFCCLRSSQFQALSFSAGTKAPQKILIGQRPGRKYSPIFWGGGGLGGSRGGWVSGTPPPPEWCRVVQKSPAWGCMAAVVPIVQLPLTALTDIRAACSAACGLVGLLLAPQTRGGWGINPLRNGVEVALCAAQQAPCHFALLLKRH